MVYSFCPYCGAVIPDPAWCFCPSCGGRLPEAPVQDRPAATPDCLCRGIPALVFTASVFFLLVVVAILVQAFLLHPAQVPLAADAGTLPSTPGIIGNVTMPVPEPPDMNTTGNMNGPAPPFNTTSMTSAPCRTPAFARPVISITGTPAYTYPAPAMGSSSEIPDINRTSLAMRVHELVNQIRQENGRSVLGTDPALASLARAHSEDMAAHGYFGHVNLQEMDPTARGASAGYTCHKDYDTYYTYGISENLFATYRYGSVLLMGSSAIDYNWKTEETIAGEAVDAWMNSPDHRDNILDKSTFREGIGIAMGKDDLVFVTEDFC